MTNAPVNRIASDALPHCDYRAELADGVLFCRHEKIKTPPYVVSRRQCELCIWRQIPSARVRDVRPTVSAMAPRHGTLPSIKRDRSVRCVHRGADALRHERCELCGVHDRLEPVYPCALHGECTERRYKSGKRGS